jgi:membrane-bound lytic murein transglycosylase D
MDLFWQKIIKMLIIVLACSMIYSASIAAPSLEGIQIYQKNLHLSFEHKQKLANDIDRYRNADDLWDVLRAEFSLPHYENNPYVQNQIQFFLHHQDFLMEATTRAAPYLYFILQQARKRHLPIEVVLLPMIESAYNPFAYSSAGAAGIWQMMPRTASGYGIKQNWWYDGRRDVVASTRAALDYLAYLGSFFEGNWLLSLAAYDTGEGNVLAAIRRNNRDGRSTDFWSLPLAQETRTYIPRLLALAIIISHPEHYPVHLPAIRNAPYLGQVDVGNQIDLQHAAKLANMSLINLQRLNPAYNETKNPHGPSKLILPIEKVEQFTENLAQSHRINQISKQLLDSSQLYASSHDLTSNIMKNIKGRYTLKPGDTLYMVRVGDTIEKIANHFSIEAKQILAINNLKHHKLNTGDTLIIPTHTKQSPKKIDVSPGDTLYMVRKSDTIETIAAKFHTTPASLRLNNLLADGNLKEGDRVVIPKQMV